MRNFVLSYCQADKDRLAHLLRGLDRLHHHVWMNEHLGAGQQGWDEVLSQIRAADAVIVALSPAVLDSTASLLEIRYARAVGKPVLPVMIDPVNPDLLPHELSRLQLVDFTTGNDQAAFDLMAALYGLPDPEPLPMPLPEAPPVPVSYLSGLGESIQQPDMTLDEQYAVVRKLRSGLERPRERDVVIQLMSRLRTREDLYAGPARELEAAYREGIERSRPMPTPPNLASSSAALREATSRGVSDLSGVGEIIQHPAMSLEEQYAAVSNLKVAVGRPEERDAAIQLMSSLRSREDLFAGPARELDMAYQEAMERERSAPAPPTSASPTPSSQDSSPSGNATLATPSTLGPGEASVPTMTARIFISYRRAEAAFPAEMLYRQLAEHFGEDQVFKDVDSIALGDDFTRTITEAVGSCDAFIALIGDQWLTITGDDGTRRLDDPNDLVRIEVEAALARNIPVIPVLLGEARMPRPDQLPPTLSGVVKRNALELRATDFKEQVSGRLIVRLEQTLSDAAAKRLREAPGRDSAPRHG